MSPPFTPTASGRGAVAPGYAALTYDRFSRLTFPKRMTFLDHDLRDDLAAQGLPALVAGYCDWVDDSLGTPICLGWAWFRRFGDAIGQLAPGGFSRNVMFTDDDGVSLGAAHTEALLGRWLETRAWHHTTIAASARPEYAVAVDCLE